MRKGCVRVNFVAWDTEEGSEPGVFSIRFVKDQHYFVADLYGLSCNIMLCPDLWGFSCFV